jgi:hypothetical protein
MELLEKMEEYLNEATPLAKGSLDDIVKQAIISNFKKYGDVKKAKEETIKAITKEAEKRAIVFLRSALLGTN